MDKKFKIFVIIAIVLLGIAIAVSTFLVLNLVNGNKTTSAASEVSKSNLTPIDFGEAITANVYDEIGDQHIVKVNISFGVNKSSKQYKQFEKDFSEKKVIIKDEIIYTLRQQTYEMMSKADAQAKLGDELALRINELLGIEVVEAVYFSEFFVQ